MAHALDRRRRSAILIEAMSVASIWISVTIPLALVTGAPGWLGTNLVRCLLDGLEGGPPFAARARCLVHPSVDPSPLSRLGASVEVVRGDVREPDSHADFFEGAREAVLFHLAGVVHPRRVREFYEINTEGTRRILESSLAAGVKRIVAVSSNSPVGCNAADTERFTEESPYNPYLHYGRSKMLMEQLLNEAAGQGGIETVILRPCWFYGPGQPPRQSLFFRMIREGTVPVVGGGENRRSMAYIDNTCQALLLAGRSPAARNRTYWIADERPYSMNEIVDTIESLLEREFGLEVRRKRRRVPGFFSKAAYGLDCLIQSLGFYHQKIHVLSEMNKTIACSVDRASRELGYRPSVALEEGMRRSIRWCLDQGHPL